MIGGSITPVAPSADELAARYEDAYRIVYRLVGDATIADVLARDALVHASAGGGRFPRRSADARACLHAATLALRDELWFGRRRSLPGGTGFGEIPHREERHRLRMAVRTLLGRQRSAFVLEHLAGWSPADVATELSMSSEAQRRLSERVLTNVRRRCEIQLLGDESGAA